MLFLGLSEGTYCLSIDSASAANAAILGEGRWSFPAEDTGDVVVTLLRNDTFSGANFFWDMLVPPPSK